MSSLLRTEWITEAVSLSFLTLKQRMCWVSEPQVSSLYFLWKLNVMNCRPRWIVVLRDAPAQILWYASASVSAVFVFIHSTDGYVSQHALLPSHMFVFDCVHVCLCLIVSSRSFLTLSLCFWRRPRWLEWACPPGRTSWLCSTPRTAGTSWCACRAWCLPMRAASGSWLAPYSATSRGEWWVMGGGRGGNKCWYRLNLSTWLEKITGTIFFTYHCAGGWTRCSLSWQDVNINGVLLSLVSLEN